MSRSVKNENKLEISRIVVKKIQSCGTNFTGTGDASASLLLAWTHILRGRDQQQLQSRENEGTSSSGGSSMGLALLNTIETIQAILQRTISRQTHFLSHSRDSSESDTAGVEKAFQARVTELCLIESRFDIMTPPRNIPAFDKDGGRLEAVVTWEEDV